MRWVPRGVPGLGVAALARVRERVRFPRSGERGYGERLRDELTVGFGQQELDVMSRSGLLQEATESVVPKLGFDFGIRGTL